jgi:hypothetical protein
VELFLVPGRTLFCYGWNYFAFCEEPFPQRVLHGSQNGFYPEPKQGSSWNQKGFYPEPNRVLPGTKQGSTWNQKGFSYEDSRRTF